MNNNLYTEKLAWFKQNERPEVVLLLANNPDLIKIVVAWTNLDVRRADTTTGFTDDSGGGSMGMAVGKYDLSSG